MINTNDACQRTEVAELGGDVRRGVPGTMTLGATIFLTNDLLLVLDGPSWLLTDWGLRAVIVAAFLLPLASRVIAKRHLGRPRWPGLLAWTALCVAAGSTGMTLAHALVPAAGPVLLPAPR